MTDPPFLTPAQEARIHALIHITPAMRHYSLTMAVLMVLFEALGLLWLVFVLSAGASSRIDDWAKARVPAFYGRVALYVVSYRLLRLAVFIPLAICAGYTIPHVYGLSTQPFAAWTGDELKSWAVDVVIDIAIASVLLAFIRRSPNRWPVWFAAAMAPLIALGIFAEPLLIDPLFNKFTPLPASSPLYAPIEALSQKAGIGNAKIFVVDKSRQTNETNAYVTGIGSSSRIVIWDTLIAKMPPDEVDAVVAHETGHYVEHHIVIGFGVSVVVLFVAMPLFRVTALAMLRRFGTRWRITSLDQPAALPVILLVVSLYSIPAAPIAAAASRFIEHRADAFGLALNGDRSAAAKAFIALSRDNLSDPNPPAWIVLFLDHPPLSERVAYALHGRPSREWPIPPLLPKVPVR